ncbi:MAG TPA: DUF5615 family PIN-like protein [Verrucomicrobiota bacterium]|nr:DUF5615 family PIN-like protein [Verrucomicrobiota bacterium]
MASFYSNENIPLSLVEALRRRGHDVLTSFEAGQANQGFADEGVLQFAAGQGRIVLTFNRRHFKRLHRQTRGEHGGIVSCSPEPDILEQARRLDELLRSLPGLAGRHLSFYLRHHHLE